MNLINSIPKADYEILELNRGKANPINNDLVTTLRQNLARIENDARVRGVVLTGNTPGFFSVGLDLKELYYNDEKQITAFWKNWDALVMEMIKFPKPIVAAINGYSPAGGCVLAVTCDYRFMADGEKFVIGLNETSVGIVVPEYIFQLYQFWVGKRLAYINLMEGKLLKVHQAKEINLIDEVCKIEELLPKAQAYLEQLLTKPDNILINSKRNLRAELIERIEKAPKVDMKSRLKAWFDPKSRAMMKALVDNLSERSKKRQ